MNWQRDLKDKVKSGEPLKDKTTFKIGGRAKFFCQPRSIADLKLLVMAAKKYRIPLFIIGAGSNILVNDKGVDGLVIGLNSAYFKRISFRDNFLNAGCGLSLRQLIQLAKERSLAGLEFLAGIPGTVGGALAMNAGAWGRSIGELVEKATVMDYNGDIEVLTKKQMKFSYRNSSLQKYIILNIYLKLKKKNKRIINEKITGYLAQRRNSQDNSLPNAGCIFKNPSERISAGRLIDLCGLKGRNIGDAFISLRHANFVLNKGNARARDVLKLMELAKREVRKKYRINLEPEIKIWR
jgi:UDP-N-acetylmuramate dehydrogenase